jgi:hypothetical protein
MSRCLRFLLYCIGRKALNDAGLRTIGTFFSIAFDTDTAYTRRAILQQFKIVSLLSFPEEPRGGT